MLRIQARDLAKHYRLRPPSKSGLSRLLPAGPRRLVKALDGVSLEVREGEALGVIGENGAGKTTLLKLLAGITKPSSGEFKVDGRLAVLLDLASGFRQDFTARENILLAGAMQGYADSVVKDRMQAILEFAGLEGFADQPMRTFSDGMRVRLGFSVSALLPSQVLLVDEVLAVGDQRFQRKCIEWVKDFLSSGGSMVLVSHSMHLVANMCSRVLWLEKGRPKELGPAQDVVDSYVDHMRQLDDEDARSSVGSLPQQDENVEGTGDAGPVKGSKEAVITSVRILDETGREREEFRTGEHMEVEVRFRAHQRIESPSLGVAFFRNDGVYVYGANTRFDREKAAQRSFEGDHSFSLVLDSLPLLSGTYEVSAALYDKEHVFPYDFHERLYRFRVRSDTEEHGVVRLGHEWKIV